MSTQAERISAAHRRRASAEPFPVKAEMSMTGRDLSGERWTDFAAPVAESAMGPSYVPVSGLEFRLKTRARQPIMLDSFDPAEPDHHGPSMPSHGEEAHDRK